MNTQTLAIIAIAAVVGLVFAATIVQELDARRQDRLQVARSGARGQVQNVEKQQQGDTNIARVEGVQIRP